MIVSYLFSGRMKCIDCGGNYRGRMERKVRSYICSTYNNYGAVRCGRFVVREDDIADVISKHFDSDSFNVEDVQLIEVSSKNQTITIKYSDNSQSIISGSHYSI